MDCAGLLHVDWTECRVSELQVKMAERPGRCSRRGRIWTSSTQDASQIRGAVFERSGVIVVYEPHDG
jgi:hypothetical protein